MTMHSPVDKGTLGVHEVKLVVEPSPRLCDRRRVAQHAHAPGQEDHPGTGNLILVTLAPWQGRRQAQQLVAGS